MRWKRIIFSKGRSQNCSKTADTAITQFACGNARSTWSYSVLGSFSWTGESYKMFCVGLHKLPLSVEEMIENTVDCQDCNLIKMLNCRHFCNNYVLFTRLSIWIVLFVDKCLLQREWLIYQNVSFAVIWLMSFFPRSAVQNLKARKCVWFNIFCVGSQFYL